jgi:phage shock protein A
MASFLSKLRVVVLGEANDLLDKTIDMNSPSVLRQYTRDLEDALGKMQLEAATQAAQITTLNREHADLAIKIDAGKKAIIALQAGGNTDLARARAAGVVELQSQYDRNATELENQKLTSANLDAAVAKLESKHTVIVARVHELERIDRQSKAENQSADTLAAANKLVGTGASISIDDIEAKVRARGDVSHERFTRAMADTVVPEDPEQAGAVDDLLASLAPKKTA